MEQSKLNIVYINIDELKPYKNNPRIIGEDAINAVATSIKEFGFKVPMVVDSEFSIVCGHNRYLACKKLNIKEVPCIVADDLTPEQLKMFRLVDNKVSEFAKWDFELLDVELEELNFCEDAQFDFEDFGFTQVNNNDDLDVDSFLTDGDDGVEKKKTKSVVCPHCQKEFEI